MKTKYPRQDSDSTQECPPRGDEGRTCPLSMQSHPIVGENICIVMTGASCVCRQKKVTKH